MVGTRRWGYIVFVGWGHRNKESWHTHVSQGPMYWHPATLRHRLECTHNLGIRNQIRIQERWLPQQQGFAPNHFGDFIPLVSHSSQLLCPPFSISSRFGLFMASAYPFSLYSRVYTFSLSSPLPSLCGASAFVLQQLRSLLCVSDSDVLIEEDLIGVINHLGPEGSWETIRRGPHSAGSGQGKHPEIWHFQYSGGRKKEEAEEISKVVEDRVSDTRNT